MKCVLFALIAVAAATNPLITNFRHDDNPNTAFYTYLGDVLPEEQSQGWLQSYAVEQSTNAFEINGQTYTNGVLASGAINLDYHVGNRFIKLDFCIGANVQGTQTPCAATVTVTGTRYTDGTTVAVHTESYTSGAATCVADLNIRGLSKLNFQSSTESTCELAIVDGKLLEDPEVDCVEVSKEVPGTDSVGATGAYAMQNDTTTGVFSISSDDSVTHKSWYTQHGFHIGGQRYTTGVFAARADSNLVYLPANTNHNYTTVSGSVGQDDSAVCASATYQVLVNGAVVWTSATSAGSAPYSFDVDFSGATKLELKTIGGEACTKTAWVDTHYCTANFAEPVNCEWTDWMITTTGHPGNCDRSCGAGIVESTRTHEVEARRGGAVCEGPNYNFTACSGIVKCSTDCEMGDWATVIACSHSCGTGEKSEFRNVAVPELNGGTCNYAVNRTTTCTNTLDCPDDCHVGQWSVWTDAVSTVTTFDASTHEASGYTCHDQDTHLTRTRTVTNGTYGGKACPVSEETRYVHSARCPINCVFDEDWTNVGTCTATCGGGAQARKRTVTHPQFGGSVCPVTEDFVDCNTQACPVDCILGAWASWNAGDASVNPNTCDRTCGAGAQHRHRTITRDFAHGGSCNGEETTGSWSAAKWLSVLSETRSCDGSDGSPNLPLCPGDCIVTRFSPWSLCDQTCGSRAESVRSRSIHQERTNGGRLCPHLEETRACNTLDCCPEDVVYGTWTTWGSCMRDGAVATCGAAGAIQTRTRVNTTEGTCGGVLADDSSKTETKSCMEQACPKDCAVGDWTGYGECSATCNAGVAPTKMRTRDVTTETIYGGTKCPALEEHLVCNTDTKCPIDCIPGDWSNFGQCTATCYAMTADDTACTGTNDITRTRVRVHVAALNGGTCKDSNGADITNDLTYDQICDGSTYDGSQSPTLQPCPIDASAGDWGDWDGCSSTCGQGSDTRTRVVINRAAAICTNGTSAPIATETRTCTGTECPQTCLYTPWSNATCSQACSTDGSTAGILQQVRTVIRFGYVVATATAPGITDNCDERTRDVEGGCNAQACPIDCTDFERDGTTFTDCSATCGTGFHTTIMAAKTCTEDADCSAQGKCTSGVCAAASGGGDNSCNTVGTVSTCNTEACPVDCILGAWGAWGDYSKTCKVASDIPLSVRERSILRDAVNGGYCTDELAQSKTDDTMPDCPTSCANAYSVWASWGDCDVTCGGRAHSNTTLSTGQQTRTRTTNDATACTETTEARACNHQQCPIACVEGPWSAFGACTDTANDITQACNRGGFKQLRTRTIVTQAQFGGDNSCTWEDEQDCVDVQDCEDPAPMGDWTAFGSCTGNCGEGSRTRTRSCDKTNAAQICDTIEDKESCVSACDCEISDWSSDGRGCFHTDQWGNYKSTTCSYATPLPGSASASQSTEIRTITQVPNTEGKSCAAVLADSSDADHSTGADTHIGAVIATRSTVCDGLDECDVDCEYKSGTTGLWANSGSCKSADDSDCGSNTFQLRQREIATLHSGSGISCVSENASSIVGDFEQVSVPCHAAPCPVNCETGDWEVWSACSATCGTAREVRRKPILVVAAHGGTCEATEEVNTDCAADVACPVDCHYAAFGSWSGCNATCGGGSMTRTRVLDVTGADGGDESCGISEDSKACNVHACTEETASPITTPTNFPTTAPTKAGEPLETSPPTPHPTPFATNPPTNASNVVDSCDAKYFSDEHDEFQEGDVAGTVNVGFVGTGSATHDGHDESCNLCKCYAGGRVGCQTKTCEDDYNDHAADGTDHSTNDDRHEGRPDGSAHYNAHDHHASEYKACSSTSCKFEYIASSSCATHNHVDQTAAALTQEKNNECFKIAHRDEVKFLKTIHAGAEANGNHHFCAYNLKESACECRCWTA